MEKVKLVLTHVESEMAISCLKPKVTMVKVARQLIGISTDYLPKSRPHVGEMIYLGDYGYNDFGKVVDVVHNGHSNPDIVIFVKVHKVVVEQLSTNALSNWKMEYSFV